MPGLVPGIHDLSCHSRESGNPVIIELGPYLSTPGLLDCPVKPGNDKKYGWPGQARP
jgi:hypothetical protein